MHDQLLTSKSMNKSTNEIQKEAVASLNKTANLQQVLAQLEASLLRKETQKVYEKAKDT